MDIYHSMIRIGHYYAELKFGNNGRKFTLALIIHKINIMETTTSFLEELKKYFKSTPREKVLKDWNKSEKFDTIGPTMDEFLSHTDWLYKLNLPDSSTDYNITLNKKPGNVFGFFCLTNPS